jgi:hypothetical protein
MHLILAAALAAAGLPVRSVSIPAAAVSKPIRIDCPVGQLTQIVFPERLILLKASAGAADDLGVSAEQSSPVGMVSVRPRKTATGTLELRGPTLVLTVVVRGVETGGGSEIRLTLASPAPAPTPKPTAPPTSLAQVRIPETAARPTPAPTPLPTVPAGPPVTMPAPPPTTLAAASPSPPPLAPRISPSSDPVPSVGGFNSEALKTAKPVSIGRREGLPGEPEMVLDAAFRGDQSIWLRFVLVGSPKSRVERITWEGGEVQEFVQEPAGKDLRILVQLPRTKVSERTRVTIKINSGGTYRFALNTGTFADFLKGLFR